MPGPQPKPNEVARKLGNPGRKKLPNKSNLVALPTLPDERPESLGAAGARFWDDAVSTCRGWLASSDYQILRMCAEAMDRRAFMLNVLATEGWSIVTDKGYPYKHPLVSPLLDLETQITKWMSALGMTPSDRSRLGLAEVKAQSVLEQLRQKRE